MLNPNLMTKKVIQALEVEKVLYKQPILEVLGNQLLIQ